MAPKPDPKQEQRFDNLLAEVNDLSDDIKETEQLSFMIATNPSQATLFKARVSRLDSTYEKFRTMANEAISLGQSLSYIDAIETLKVLKKECRELYYKILAVEIKEIKSDSQSISLNQSIMEPSTRTLKLPSINLPTFNGDVSDWISYRDTFTSLIHENPDLAEIQKFHYLKSSLKGQAALAISAIGISAAGYAQAWESLGKRYDNKRLQASNYLVKIFNFKPIQKATFNSLEQFSQIILESAVAFKSLNLKDPAGFILYTYALRLLDARTRERFEAECSGMPDIPDFEFFAEFIHRQFLQLQANNLSLSPNQQSCANPTPYRNPKQVVLTTKEDSSNSCPLCHQRHRIYRCKQFLKLNPTKRFEEVKALSLCVNCLVSSHSSLDCKSINSCRLCGKRHNSLLHFNNNRNECGRPQKPAPKPQSNSPEPQNPASTVLSSATTGTLSILLGTAVARMQDIHGNFRKIRIIIDSGAQRSFITNECAKQLGLLRSHNPHTLKGFANSPISGGKYQTTCSLIPRDKYFPQLTTSAVIIQNITDLTPSSRVPSAVEQYFSHYELADPNFASPGHIDFLLGADLFAQILTGESLSTPEGMPNALKTIYGWVILGPFHTSAQEGDSQISTLMASTQILEDLSLDKVMKQFWEVEEVASIQPKNPADLQCEQHFVTTHSRDTTGRYIVRLPFKEDKVELGDSYQMALHRLHRLEVKLVRYPKLKQEYANVLQEHLQQMYISPTNKQGKYILPHHGVVKDGSTTSLRIVFDGSAKTISGSLNDKLLAGPKLQLDIRDVLLRFRLFPIALIADIHQMYLQILVHPDDRAFQHFLYRFNIKDSVQEFEINRVTFGLSCSPFLALRVIRQLVHDEGASYPLSSRALTENIYVDDILTGADTIEDAIKLQKELVSILNKGGFKLKKWASNAKNLLHNLESNDYVQTVSLSNLEEPSIKILGIQWDSVEDFLSYKIQTLDYIPTKRGIMSTIARMYDPLGYLSPVTFQAKTILQALWKNKFDWDEPINNAIATEWKALFHTLAELRSIRIPRCILPNKNSEITVVGFADASSLGYAAVIYLRIKNQEGVVNTYLLFSKTRLAPLKTLSIPRLELCAAFLLVQTIDALQNFFSGLKVKDIYLLTDSTIVLSWLNTPPYKLKTFVANRVVKILESTSFEDWYHVESKDNLADLASRGTSPSFLTKCDVWWTGFPWIYMEPKSWPISKLNYIIQVPELKTESSNIMNVTAQSEIPQIMERFSTWGRLVRTFGLIQRFVHNCKSVLTERRRGPLTVNEIEKSTRILIKITQQFYFNSKSPLEDSNLQALSPFIDSQGIVRVGGRLANSPLPYTAKHPIILPPKAHITSLIIDDMHRNYLHAGPQLLVSLLRRRYWVIAARRIVRSRIHQCVTCHRFKARNYSPIMADLPNARFQQGRPFINTGLDFAGPFITKENSRKNSVRRKSYVCLFVCLSTKAVHIELVSHLTTEAFLAALDRFIGRRGLPNKILSDNGRNFIGADRYLKELCRWLKLQETQDKIAHHLSSQLIKWEFIPPAAPHFGGIWEAGVKSFKQHLRRVMKTQVLTQEEFNTLIIRIEAVLNSRPLYPMTSSPQDYDVLTPGHFIIGTPLVSLPDECSEIPTNRLSRWQLLKKCLKDIWNRWRYDYLNALQMRSKWKTKTEDLKPGILVLLKEPDVQPLHWPVGRVIETYPGPDGVVRVVQIQTSQGIYTRPVRKLAPLLPDV